MKLFYRSLLAFFIGAVPIIASTAGYVASATPSTFSLFRNGETKPLAADADLLGCVKRVQVLARNTTDKFYCRGASTVTVTNPPQPPDEVQQVSCPAGSLTGATWQQTRTYAPAPFPVFWSPQAWMPAQQPQTAGTCPPAPPPIHMHGGIDVDPTTIPVGLQSPAKDVEDISSPPRDTNLKVGTTSGEADFRTVCAFSHAAYDDSIVYPGQPGVSHLHNFFGNTLSDANSTVTSLKTTGSSTCRGGIVNRSSYWIPAMVDVSVTPARYIRPRSMLVYYKSPNGDPKDVKPFPPGLVMIAGNPSATFPVIWGASGFSCSGFAQGSDHTEPFPDPRGPHTIPINDCIMPDGTQGEVWGGVVFPECWDGKNLDSPDHRSHMAYWRIPNIDPATGKFVNTCPADHPVHLPMLSIGAIWTIPPGSHTKDWKLVSDTGLPGTSMHGDYREGWNRNGGPNKDIDRAKQWVEGCLNKIVDCGAALLDDHTEMNSFGNN